MSFIIAKPADHMSGGDLFYTRPHMGANCEPFKQLAQICRNRASEQFPLNADHPENEAIIQQIEKELNIIDKTDKSIAGLELSFFTALFS